ncbi:MAG: cytochrome b N-terminal domain-containing protein [Candidatus Brocadiaceae bacterium]|nr:cytochrome b N-terminal domain-containing protein [Candidatus Brocadiaceae bacterium]
MQQDKTTENASFLKECIEKNITRKLIPRGMSWFGCMGGLSLVAFLIQLGTGIFLLLYYIPNEKNATESIQRIIHGVPYGWLFHRIHSTGPHIMIGMVFSHMIRIFFKRIYRHPRELHWVSGASLLILTVFMYYTGTMLSLHPMNEKHAISLTYFYAMHIVCIPIVMALFMGMHFFMIRQTGIYEPL